MNPSLVKAGFLIAAAIGFMLVNTEFRSNLGRIIRKMFGREKAEEANVELRN